MTDPRIHNALQTCINILNSLRALSFWLLSHCTGTALALRYYYTNTDAYNSWLLVPVVSDEGPAGQARVRQVRGCSAWAWSSCPPGGVVEVVAAPVHGAVAGRLAGQLASSPSPCPSLTCPEFKGRSPRAHRGSGMTIPEFHQLATEIGERSQYLGSA